MQHRHPAPRVSGCAAPAENYFGEVAFVRVVAYARCLELLTQDELVRLTPPERLALISQLWDSLDDEQLPLTAAQRAELDRRLASLDQDRHEGTTWEALHAELERRCP